MSTTAESSISCSEVWGGNRAIEVGLDLPGLHGWVCSRPYHGQAEGGDVHYVSSCGTGRITRVMLADVSGHGQEVAGLSRKLQRAMQRYLNHERPHALTRRLNRDMRRLTAGTGLFATALVITYFSPKGRMSICNAGHPPPLIYRARKKTWGFIDQPDTESGISNLPLGVVEEVGYVGRTLTLSPGDLIFAYTDCLIETGCDIGKPLGLHGLRDTLNALDPAIATENPGELTDALLEAIDSRGCGLEDDMTAVVLQCTGRSHGAGVRKFFGGVGRVIKQLRHPSLLPWPGEILRP